VWTIWVYVGVYASGCGVSVCWMYDYECIVHDYICAPATIPQCQTGSSSRRGKACRLLGKILIERVIYVIPYLLPALYDIFAALQHCIYLLAIL
jgi:hypothetical protein